jgi:hypothetical protein
MENYSTFNIYIFRADPRQDPLLGPLLAELDAMSNQQKQLPESSSSNYRRNSVPYQPNLIPPIGSSPSNHGKCFSFFFLLETFTCVFSQR